MALNKLPPTMDFISDNKSLRNTTFASPDGATIFIIDTPNKHALTKLSTISSRDTQSDRTTLLATLEFKLFGADMLTFKDQEPVFVKDWIPRGAFGRLGW